MPERLTESSTGGCKYLPHFERGLRVRRFSPWVTPALICPTTCVYWEMFKKISVSKTNSVPTSTTNADRCAHRAWRNLAGQWMWVPSTFLREKES